MHTAVDSKHVVWLLVLLVLFFAGDKIPADIRLVVCKTATLRAEQASLTGEPQAVLKGVEPVKDANCELQVGCSCQQ